MEDFLSVVGQVERLTWKDCLGKVSSYDGEVVRAAIPLSYERAVGQLPAAGVCGRVPVAELAKEGLGWILQRPEEILLPREAWPERPQQKRLLIEKGEEEKLFAAFEERGLCRRLHRDHVVGWNDGLLLNGMFGVEKSGPAVGGLAPLRTIMNLVPTNELCRVPSWGISSLPYIAALQVLQVRDEEDLFLVSDDLSAYIYLFSLPRPWHPFLCFSGTADSEGRYLCSAVLPMGWQGSVAIGQHLHRRLILRATTLGAELDPALEFRKDRAGPRAASEDGGDPTGRVVDYFSIYLDNFDSGKALARGDQTGLVDLADRQAKVRRVYRDWGLPTNPGKAVESGTTVEVLGALIKGSQGFALARPAKIGETAGAVVLVLERNILPAKVAEVLGGRLTYISQFRRPTMSLRRYLWEYLGETSRVRRDDGRLPVCVAEELIMSLGALPACRLDFRQKSSTIVTCSDASETGGGACAAEVITEEGRSFMQAELARGRCEAWPGEVAIVTSGFGAAALLSALDALRVVPVEVTVLDLSPLEVKLLTSRWTGDFREQMGEELSDEELRRIVATSCCADAILLLEYSHYDMHGLAARISPLAP